jgi:Helicase conserved C-terminal domain
MEIHNMSNSSLIDEPVASVVAKGQSEIATLTPSEVHALIQNTSEKSTTVINRSEIANNSEFFKFLSTFNLEHHLKQEISKIFLKEDATFFSRDKRDFSKCIGIALLIEEEHKIESGQTVFLITKEDESDFCDIVENYSKSKPEAIATSFEVKDRDSLPRTVFGSASELANVLNLSDANLNIERIVVVDATKQIATDLQSLFESVMALTHKPQLIYHSTEDEFAIKETDLIEKFFRSAKVVETHYYLSLPADAQARLDYLLSFLVNEKSRPAIVFCNHSSEIGVLTGFLSNNGIKIEKVYSGRAPSVRGAPLPKIYDDVVVLATDASIDNLELDQFSLVINFSIPSNPESYIHRTQTISRNPARKIINFVAPLDYSNFIYIQKITESDFTEVPPPKLETLLEHRLAEFEAAVTKQSGEIQDPKLVALAGLIINSPKSIEIISLLIKGYRSRSSERFTLNDNNRSRDSKPNGRDTSSFSEDKRDSGRFEPQIHTTPEVEKRSSRIYFGKGTLQGVKSDELSSLKINKEGTDYAIERVIVRDNYAFIDIDELASEELLTELNKLGGDEMLAVKKAVTITSRDRIEDAKG